MDMIIRERITELLESKEWAFVDFQNMQGIVSSFTDTIFQEMDAQQKLDLVWEIDVDAMLVQHMEGYNPFGELFYQLVSNEISQIIIKILKEELPQANVSFGNKNKEENENEIPKRSVGRKSSKKRTTNEKKDSK